LANKVFLEEHRRGTNLFCVPMQTVTADALKQLEAANVPTIRIGDKKIAGKKITGMGNDGGQEIISRFFQEAGPYLAKNGEILMPYSSIAGAANNPDAVASSLHWHGTRELTAEKAGIEHSIYAFRPQR
jgi:hypothetical protein